MASQILIMLVLAFAVLQLAQLSICTTEGCSLNLPSCGLNKNNASLCCPYKNGVCCNDKTCCPENSRCFPNAGMCMPLNYLGLLKTNQLFSAVPLHSQEQKIRIKIEVCPSKTMACPSKSTCCPSPYIGYDCCPLVHGNCCSDFKHCCPYNTTCDVSKGQCVDAYQNKIPWMKKLRGEKSDFTHVKKNKQYKTVVKICPDQNTKCEHHHTCCSLFNDTNKYECCKYANGVCCSDGKQCCPQGSICDNSTSGCKNVIYSPAKKQLINGKDSTTHSINICPGGQWTCPDYMTCCPISGQKYGCCPYPKAVCCLDNWHCCPSGSKCDTEHDKCSRGGMFTPLFKKIPATYIGKPKQAAAPLKTFKDLICPDGTACRDDSTCCQTTTLKFGCCPVRDAVCCEDKQHCCEHGMVCNIEKQRCERGNHVDFMPFQKINETCITNP